MIGSLLLQLQPLQRNTYNLCIVAADEAAATTMPPNILPKFGNVANLLKFWYCQILEMFILVVI